jgi:hypothetical protein
MGAVIAKGRRYTTSAHEESAVIKPGSIRLNPEDAEGLRSDERRLAVQLLNGVSLVLALSGDPTVWQLKLELEKETGINTWQQALEICLADGHKALKDSTKPLSHYLQVAKVQYDFSTDVSDEGTVLLMHNGVEDRHPLCFSLDGTILNDGLEIVGPPEDRVVINRTQSEHNYTAECCRTVVAKER